MFKKTLYVAFIVAFVAFFGLTSRTLAAGETFNQYVGYGSKGTEVIYLQQFLIDNGFLNIPVATGNYLSLTTAAVKKYQASQNIINTGYFGPLTSAAANSKLQLANLPIQSAVGNVAIAHLDNTATTFLANSNTITWQTNDYPTNAGVNINLLRKVSNSPVSYEFVQSIAANTLNDGRESWTPSLLQSQASLYIEVTCAGLISGGCQSEAPVSVL